MNSLSCLPEAVLSAILESPPNIVIFALDRQFRYLAFNQNHARTMRQIWGADIRVGDDMLALIQRDDDRDKARRNFERALAGESFVVEEEYGSESMLRAVYENCYSPIRWVNDEVIGLTVYLTDVTAAHQAQTELSQYREHLEVLVRQRTSELEALHAQLLHAQKMESLGVLAGGIAHDFNNLLAVILSRVELAQLQQLDPQSIATHLETIKETTLEARLLTRQLLTYSGKGRFKVETRCLNDVVRSMTQLLRASVSHGILLEFDLAQGELPVDVDPTQVRQVLLNLVTNAAEAIGSRPGCVQVRTRIVELTESKWRDARLQTRCRPGRFAVVEVCDDGEGMTEDVKLRLFEPFFTTKFSGRGLGMAAVLGIVDGHRGTLYVSSHPGSGTRIEVLFPVSAHPIASPTPRPPPNLPQLGGSETILVVDDDAAVRCATSETLSQLGYAVCVAASGTEAIDLYRAAPQRIDLVILDLTMPVLSGEDTFKQLREIDPSVRVILFTGYAENETRLRCEQVGLAGFLAKPFDREELAVAVRAGLAASKTAVGHGQAR